MNKMISCIKKYSKQVRNEINNTTEKWANVIKKKKRKFTEEIQMEN